MKIMIYYAPPVNCEPYMINTSPIKRLTSQSKVALFDVEELVYAIEGIFTEISFCPVVPYSWRSPADYVSELVHHFVMI